MTKFRSAACGLLAIALLATGCSSSGSGKATASGAGNSGSSAASGTPFTVLMDADFTGPAKAYGVQFQLGAQAAADYINATRGGIDGHKVVIKTESSNGDPSQATSVLTKYLSSNPAPNLTWMGTSDLETAALIPLVQRKGLLGIGGQDGGGLLQNGGGKTYPLEFTSQASTVPVVENVAKWATTNGYKKIGILAADNDYSTAETAQAKTAFASAGLTDTVVNFATDAVDLSSQVAQLQSAGVDAVYFEGLTQNMGYAIKARTKLSFDVPWMADLAASSLDITTIGTPADLKGVSEIQFRPSVVNANVPGLAVMEKYAATHTSIAVLDKVPAHIAGLAWDAVLVVANAAAQAKSIDPTAIAKALESLGAGASDPDYINYAKISYTDSDHTPVTASAADYPIVPIGPISGGQVQAPTS
jgi:ABC-type branched-subunit amino acid transport system substrate-binding protein